MRPLLCAPQGPRSRARRGRALNGAPEALPLYILAGGRSSRFGSDKARAALGGRALVQEVAGALRPHVASITIVAAEAGAYDDLGFRTLGDLEPGLGPMGGLASALADMTRPGWLALAACDWAGLQGSWLAALRRAARPGDRCVLYAGPRPEPLFALYHTAIAPEVRRRLANGQQAMRELAASVPHCVLPPPQDWPRAANINRREDLARYSAAHAACGESR